MDAGPSGLAEVSNVEADVVVDESSGEDEEVEQGPGPQMDEPTDDDFKVFLANQSPKLKLSAFLI